jgi:hypothetical protein
MARSPKRAAILWGVIAGLAGLVVMIVIALNARRPGDPPDAMRKRGQAAAPVVLLAAAVGAGAGYLVAKRRGG